MKPHFIITIIDTDETKYDGTNGRIVQPISMIYYEFEQNPDGTVGYKIGLLDNTVEGNVQNVNGEPLPVTLEETQIDVDDWVQPLAEMISNNFPEDRIAFSLMGYEPDENDAASMNLYNLSVGVTDEIVSDFYDTIKNSERTEDVNYDRVLKWMKHVANNGARNTPGTMTAILVNLDGTPKNIAPGLGAA